MIKLFFPCKYIGITQGYKSSHSALDLGWDSNYGGPNHKIIAPADGKVISIKKNYNKTDEIGSSYGNYVQIDHGDGVQTLVPHLKYNSVNVKVGDKVKKGQLIGLMGNTGHSTGVHCHYEVRISGKRVDPLKYTYVDETYTISNKSKNNYKILVIEEEIDNVNKENLENNIIFSYDVLKDGVYIIKLSKGETLFIKNKIIKG